MALMVAAAESVDRLKRVRALGPVVALLILLCASAREWAGEAHQHGVARLDIAVDAGRISLQRDSPLDKLLGFERAPRNDA